MIFLDANYFINLGIKEIVSFDEHYDNKEIYNKNTLKS